MATLEKLRPRPEATTANLKHEATEYLQRASSLEQNKQYDEASVLYKRVVSLIHSHEDTSVVDDELSSIKRHANQLLLQSSLRKNQTADSNHTYQNMVRQLSSHVPQTTNERDLTEMSEQVFEDPSAFQPITNDGDQEESNTIVLFQLDAGAKLFYLAKDGSIQTTSETLPLTIFLITYVSIFEDRKRIFFEILYSEDGETCGLLKLGTWIYPLHPKVSPAFKTGYDAYIFPNNTSVGRKNGLTFSICSYSFLKR
jgi:hypothetical protein